MAAGSRDDRRPTWRPAALAPAFAKVNLCLLMGAPRADGRHELVTLFESVGLADDLRLTAATGEAGSSVTDEVVCPGVRGPNLVSAALEALRERGWAGPPLRVEIDKRIPVAAGMGGGSSDAAAVLRAAVALGPAMDADALAEIAAGLGSDVPSQLDPGVSLGLGAGDHVTPLPDLAAHAVVVVPQRFWLSTAHVYREADRLGLGRDAAALLELRAELEAGLAADGRPALAVNDLQAAALSLCPEIQHGLDAVREAGIEQALVCGSGPTVIGVVWGADALARAQTAAGRPARAVSGCRGRRAGAQRGRGAGGEPVIVWRNLRRSGGPIRRDRPHSAQFVSIQREQPVSYIPCGRVPRRAGSGRLLHVRTGTCGHLVPPPA